MIFKYMINMRWESDSGECLYDNWVILFVRLVVWWWWRCDSWHLLHLPVITRLEENYQSDPSENIYIFWILSLLTQIWLSQQISDSLHCFNAFYGLNILIFWPHKPGQSRQTLYFNWEECLYNNNWIRVQLISLCISYHQNCTICAMSNPWWEWPDTPVIH